MLRCLIATLGEDAPGVNAAIRASTRLALKSGLATWGARRGFHGILRGQLRELKASDVGRIIGSGGSVLGSAEFASDTHDADALQKIARELKEFDLVVGIGGLGSFSILDRIYTDFDLGTTTTLFIPASVENEFLNPRRGEEEVETVHAESIGADTAANTGIAAVDRLRAQSYMSRTVFLVECVGSKSNYLPIQIGASCGAHRIYLPPYPLISDETKSEIRKLCGREFNPNEVDAQELARWIERMFDKAKRNFVIVVVSNGTPLLTIADRKGGERSLPVEPYSNIVASMAPLELTVLRLVDQLSMHFSQDDVQIRYVVIDDLQLGGTPTVRDRMLGSLYGEAAVEEFHSIVHSQDTDRRGNLNLLAISDTETVSWRCHPRSFVKPLYTGPKPRAGGLNPLPFLRQMSGTMSGFRPWATL